MLIMYNLCMSKKITIGVVILLLVGGGFFYIMNGRSKSPDRIVEEFYDNGGQYKNIPELVDKVRDLHRSAGSETGEPYQDKNGLFFGIDYDPMFCAQDSPETRTYELISEANNKASVKAHHLYRNFDGTLKDNEITVLLEMRSGNWNITDVICPFHR